MLRSLFWQIPFLVLFVSCATTPAPQVAKPDPVSLGKPIGEAGIWTRVGQLQSPELLETSGLVASSRSRNLFWAINDSGMPAYLYALDRRGMSKGEVRVSVPNVDWEDLAKITLEGKPLLVIADTGDNLKRRFPVHLYLVEEPTLVQNEISFQEVAAESIALGFEGGSVDVEAVAISPTTQEVLFLAKNKSATQLYVAPLRRGVGRLTAARITELRSAPGSVGGALKSTLKRGVFGDQATALDLSPDGRRAAVLTYADCLIYRRRAGENWGAAFQRVPKRIALPGYLQQPEALAFHADGKTIMVTSEGAGAPVAEYRLP